MNRRTVVCTAEPNEYGRAAVTCRLALALAVATVALTSAAARAQPPLQELRAGPVVARALDGPDRNALYLELRAGDPAFVEPPREYVHRREGEVLIRMGGFEIERSPGDPALPYKSVRLAIPPEAVPESLQIEVLQLEQHAFQQPIRVVPAPPPLYDQPGDPEERPSESELRWEHQKWGIGKSVIDGRNLRVYEKDALYPPAFAEVASTGRLRKWQSASVRFNPVRFNPVTGEAVMAQRMVVKVTFNRDPAILKRPEVQRLLRDTTFDGKARDLFLNYERAARWYRPEQGATGTARDEKIIDPDYAIITTDTTFTTSSQLANFCFHKQDLGHGVMVVTEHDTHTVTGTPGAYAFTAAPGGYEDVTGDVPDQRPERIRKWLQDNYVALGIRYVLLVGDPDPDNVEPADHVGDIPMLAGWTSLTEVHPTDLYYSDLTGDWNHDDDEYVAENIGFAGQIDLPGGVTGAAFSVRWEGVITVTGAAAAANVYVMSTSDGPTDLWVDVDVDGFDAADQVVLRADEGAPAFSYHWFSATDGHYPVRVEFRQSAGQAYFNTTVRSYSGGVDAVFEHETAPATYAAGLEADYFNNDTFTPPAAVSQVDPALAAIYVPAGDRGAGGVDFLPEVIVGRIPIYDEDGDGSPDVSVLDPILSKIIAYEQADGAEEEWRRRVLCSTPYMYDYDDTPGNETADYEGCEELRNAVAPPPLWEWYRLHDEDYGVGAEFTGPCSPAATVAGWNDPADPDDGRGVVMWRTHGSQTSASHVFGQANCADLDDTKPSFVLQTTCLNGSPEVQAGNYPLGYSLLKRGAIATISATRVSWGGLYDPATCSIASKNNPCLLYYLAWGVLGNVEVGEVLSEVRTADATTESWNWWQIFNYNLYGDPSLSLFGTGLKSSNDVVFVLDGSGSMLSEGKWDAATDAAVLFYKLMKELRHPQFDDRYGSVVFRCMGGADATEALPPGSLRDMDDALTDASFGAYTPLGAYFTPIGRGLEAGLSQLALDDPESFYSNKHLILLSDGKHNCDIDPLSVAVPEGVNVYAVGLGEDSIEPETIEDIALASDGQYRISPSPREIEDFFVQILAETSWKLQDVTVTGSTAPIDQQQAVFIVVWDDPARTIDFDLDPPGAGADITPTNLGAYPPMTCTYTAAGAGETHAFYRCSDVPDALLGDWSFVNVHEGLAPVPPADVLLKVVVDPRVIAEFATDEAEITTGEPLILRVKMTEAGQPLVGLTDVSAELIRSPAMAVGTLMAENQPPAGHGPDPPPGADITQWAYYLQGVMLAKGITGISEVGGPTVTLRDDGVGHDRMPGDGIYTGAYADTEYEGSYTFRFRVSGTNRDGVTFARTQTLSRFVRFGASAERSKVEVVSVRENTAAGTVSAVVRVTPLDRFGAYMGPFRGERLSVWSSAGRFSSQAADRKDGSYDLTLVYPKGEEPVIMVAASGVLLTEGETVEQRRRPGFSVHLGSTIPQGQFSATYDGGASFTLDLEFPIRADLSFVALAGYNHFGGTSGISDTHILNASGNLKWDIVSTPLEIWIGGGGGAYLPEGGSTRPGTNLSIGVGKAVGQNIDLEAAVDYHLVFTPGDDTEFIVTRLGLVYRF